MENEERYISIEQSIIGSLLDVREMQAGRMPKKTWREFFAELREEDKQEELNASHRNASFRGRRKVLSSKEKV